MSAAAGARGPTAAGAVPSSAAGAAAGSAAGAAAGSAAGPSGRHHAAAMAELPTDAAAIRNILKTMGVETHEPRVVNMLLDFMYSYVSGVLSDASAFAEQVGRPPGEVEGEDVSLSIAMKARHSFVPRPTLETLRQLAEQVNDRKLPELDPRAGFGLRVPADEHLLVQQNWRINAAEAKQLQQQGSER